VSREYKEGGETVVYSGTMKGSSNISRGTKCEKTSDTLFTGGANAGLTWDITRFGLYLDLSVRALAILNKSDITPALQGNLAIGMRF
jgi:hypothetical protein